MRNPVRLAYDLFDDTLMAGANYAVRGYNWTFGGTKDELANNIVSTGCVLMSVGSLISNYVTGFFITPTSLYAGHKIQVENRRIGEIQRRAAENSVMNMEVLNFEKSMKFLGPVVYFTGSTISTVGFVLSSSLIEQEQYDLLPSSAGLFAIGLGAECLGASCYIMRADSLPPRKNVVSRMFDKAMELYEEYRKPALQPAKIEG